MELGFGSDEYAINGDYQRLSNLISSRTKVQNLLVDYMFISDMFQNEGHRNSCLREYFINPTAHIDVSNSGKIRFHQFILELNSMEENEIISMLGREDPICDALISIKQILQDFQNSEFQSEDCEPTEEFNTNIGIISNLLIVVSQNHKHYYELINRFENWLKYANSKSIELLDIKVGLENYQKITKDEVTVKDFREFFSISPDDLTSLFGFIKTAASDKKEKILKLFKKAICLYTALYPGLITVGIFSLVGFLSFATPALVIRQTMLRISNILLITSACFITAAALISFIFFTIHFNRNCAMLDAGIANANIDARLHEIKADPLLDSSQVMTEPPVSPDVALN